MTAVLGIVLFQVLVAAVLAWAVAMVIVEVLERLGLVYNPNREDAAHPAPFPNALLGDRPPVAVGPGIPNCPRVQTVTRPR